PKNITGDSEILLLRFSEKPELQPLIFGVFFSMYLITVFGNLLIILAISSDSHLHTPMYFFLSNLSCVDICFTSTTIPKMLQNIWTLSKVITYEGCIIQVHFFMLFAGLDNFLLTVMAYDCFVAICHPLHYTVIMNPQLCAILVLVSWIISVLHSSLQTLMTLRLSLCREVEIPHYYCELKLLIQLACSDNFLNDMGKYKAFSTCASCLSVVSLFYFTGLGVYLSSAATHSAHSSAITSVMYTVVTPMWNPFIYSLRYKDIKRALKVFFRMASRKGHLFSAEKVT
uniref:G-protein coupled receptors family 1 profile domain-containing protein n=1 Tax=Sus scrofa TaxID=9823 RepID=A0A4X1T186_PIG